jgi:PST family polysaccharide transporter
MSRDLARAAARGGLGTFGGSVAGFAGRFLLNAALARLIAPDSFGVYAVAQGIVGLASLPAALSFPQALLQLDRAPGLFRAALQLTLLSHLAAFALAGVGALVGGSVESATVATTVLGLGIVQLLVGPTACFEAQLQRDLRFQRVAVIRLWGLLASIAAALAVARLWPGPLVLVVRDAVPFVVSLGLAARALRGSAALREPATAEARRSALRLAPQLFVNRALEIGFHTGHILVLATLLGNRTLGFYEQARYLAGLPSLGFQPVLWSVGLRTFRELANDAARRSRALAIVDFLLLRCGLVFAIGFAVAPDLATRIVLGPGWDGAAALLPSFVPMVVAQPLLLTRQSLFTALERWTPLRLAHVGAAFGLALVLPPVWLLAGGEWLGLGYSAAVLGMLAVLAVSSGGLASRSLAPALLAAAGATALGIGVRWLVGPGLAGDGLAAGAALAGFAGLLLALEGRRLRGELAYLSGIVRGA